MNLMNGFAATSFRVYDPDAVPKERIATMTNPDDEDEEVRFDAEENTWNIG